MAFKRTTPQLGAREAWTPEKVKERIRVGVIVTRLAKHVLGKLEMSATQIRAAEILLRKCVPDLASIEHSGEVTQHYVMALPAMFEKSDDWEQQQPPARPS